MLLKDRKGLNTGGEMSFVNQNNFHTSYLFFGELKDQLLSLGEGGGGKGQRIFEDHMVFREGGGGIRKAVFRVVVSG